MKTYEYWVHRPSGETWAVMLHDGEIVSACGPLDARDTVPDILPYLPYMPLEARWVARNRAHFTRAPHMARA